MHINDLPDCILEDIFFTHVYIHRQSRWPILQTCRKWYEAACSYSTLWRNITLDSRSALLPPIRLETSTLNGLAQLVSRVGDATFDLVLGCSYDINKTSLLNIFKGSVPKDWLSRCDSLSIPGPEELWRLPDTTATGDFLHSYSYEGLERLEIVHIRSNTWEYMLEQLMDRIEKTSLNLHCLKLEGRITPEMVARSILGRPYVLARIRNLNSIDFGLPIPWAAFTNLEELTFHADETSDLSDIIAPRLTKLELGGYFAADELPSKVLDQLTHLTFLDFAFKNEEHMRPIPLPSLLSLTFICTKFDLRLIDAPKIKHFEYRTDPYDENPYTYPSFEGTTLQPSTLRIDILSNEDEHNPFEKPLYTWKKCEELHLVTFFVSSEIGDTLTDALSGTTEEQCWPAMKYLTMLYPAARGNTGPMQEEKESKVEAALCIQESRVRLGLKPLAKLEVGWYWTNNNDYVLEDPSREWWVTTWVDCLHL